VESVGGGPFAELVGRGEEIGADATLLGRETDRALLLLADIVRDTAVHRWKIAADGSDLSGEYLGVELMNTRFVGPNVPLAPQADPSDGRIDIVLIGAADRGALLDYLDERLHLASGRLPAPPDPSAHAVSSWRPRPAFYCTSMMTSGPRTIHSLLPSRWWCAPSPGLRRSLGHRSVALAWRDPTAQQSHRGHGRR